MTNLLDPHFLKHIQAVMQTPGAMEGLMGKFSEAPPAVNDADCTKISQLPSNGRVYFVDIYEKSPGDYSCHCGLVEKELGSNGKRWDHPNNPCDGLSAMVSLLAFAVDDMDRNSTTTTTSLEKNCEIMLSNVAKACNKPGELTLGIPPYSDFPIQTPSRPRKILVANEAYVVSLSRTLQQMGIPDIAVADRALTGSMKASFTYSKGMGENPGRELKEDAGLIAVNWKRKLARAAESNDSETIKQICRTRSLKQVRKYAEQQLLLYEAAKMGTPKSCRALLKYTKVDVDGKTSPSHKKHPFCRHNSSEVVLSNTSCTPLIVAVMEGNVSVVRLLLRHGADFRRRMDDPQKNTMLHMAVMTGYPDVVEELIIAGADTHQTNKEGETPLAWIKNTKLTQSNNKTPQLVTCYKRIANILHNVNRRNRCATCGAAAAGVEGNLLKACPCKLEWYCNNECQKKRWKEHKKEHTEEMEILQI